MDAPSNRPRRHTAVATLCLAFVLATLASVALPVGSVAADAQSDEATVAFGQTTTGNVFLADETPTVTVDSDADRVVWDVERYDGERVANGTVAVDGETTLSLPIERVGHYELHAWPADATGSPTTTTVGVLPADGFENEDSFYGVSTHFGQGWDHDLVRIMDAAGVASARDEHGWLSVEQSRGSYDFSGRTQAEFMELLRDRGYDRLFILVYGNPIYGGEWNHFPDDRAYRRAFANYSRAAVDRYDDLEHVEVWNEPNLAAFGSGPAAQDPAAYVDLLETTYPAVKDERASVTVVGGSTAGDPSTDTRVAWEFWRGILENGGADHMDAMAIHMYRQQPTNFATDVERLRELTQEYNDGEALPIWVTEVGWRTDSPSGVLESTQSRYLVKTHVRLRAAGVERLYWYTFRDDEPPQTESNHALWGLVRHPDDPAGAHTPKPSLSTYATMTRQLAGEDHQGQRTVGQVRVNHYADGDEHTRTLWVPSNVGARTLTIETDGPVTVTTMTGTAQRLVPHDGAVYLTVGSNPVYVEGSVDSFSEGAPVSLRGSTDDLDLAVTGEGGTSLTVTHEIADRRIELTASGDGTTTETIPVPAAYRPLRPDGATVLYLEGGHRVADTVSIDGEPVGFLSTRVRPEPITPTAAGRATAGPAATETGPTSTDSSSRSTTSAPTTTATGAGLDAFVALFALVAAGLLAGRTRL